MIKRFMTGEYAKFQDKTAVGKILKIIGRIFFGKTVYLTGLDPDGKEFFKTTTSRAANRFYKQLAENGCSNIHETEDFETADDSFKQFRKNRIRG